MRTASITYNDVPLTVAFIYCPPERQTLYYPGAPEGAEIQSIQIGGVEAYELFSLEQLDTIETKVLEVAGEHAQADAAEEYQLRRDERAMEGFL